ncbi:MAG TPA: pimeloyl-ACP methyl ester esterase BioH [Gammaproteobacteria bacterium]|nr:pimeloyl-ACP methyl ester esterase BioH [Gammaproteobacteria bacterium]HET7587910.1 pimeloyl-ACP methyl ester esterase BioH [Gammaproteobacteria bacterium]
MSLHVETAGSGPPLVLLHGWGLHAGVWNETIPALSQHYRCIAIDLPGHGESPVVEGDVYAWAEACRAAAPKGAIWLGWSLGGMIALAAALQAPADIAGLLLVSTTPRFVTAPDWPHAMAPETLSKFAAELKSDWRGTVEDFLVLQTLGAATGRVALRTLRQEVFARGTPEPAGLTAGVRILENIDLRSRLPEIQIPAKVMSGQRDRLTPPDAGKALAAALNGEFELVPRTAHAPFLSAPDVFTEWAQKAPSPLGRGQGEGSGLISLIPAFSRREKGQES